MFICVFLSGLVGAFIPGFLDVSLVVFGGAFGFVAVCFVWLFCCVRLVVVVVFCLVSGWVFASWVLGVLGGLGLVVLLC